MNLIPFERIEPHQIGQQSCGTQNQQTKIFDHDDGCNGRRFCLGAAGFLLPRGDHFHSPTVESQRRLEGFASRPE